MDRLSFLARLGAGVGALLVAPSVTLEGVQEPDGALAGPSVGEWIEETVKARCEAEDRAKLIGLDGLNAGDTIYFSVRYYGNEDTRSVRVMSSVDGYPKG